MLAFDSKELLQEQLEAIANRNPNKKPKGVALSKTTGIQYNAAMQKMIKLIKNDIDTQLMPLLKKLAPEYQTDSVIEVKDSYITDITAMLTMLVDKWTSPQVQQVANQVATAFVKKAATVNRLRFNESMRSFGLDIYGDSPAIEDMLEAAVYNNTKLIQSIPSEYMTQVESIVMTNIRAGGRPSTISKSLQKQFGVEKNRAKMIARDQTAKVNGDITAKRQQNAGFSFFRWLDSNDSRVRHRHNEIENRVTAYGKGVYRWDNPPISDSGTPIIPGQDYQCRCIAIPVSNSKVEQNIDDGLTNSSVKR